MVKLVDTLVSGTSGLTAVQVRVLFWAPETPYFVIKTGFFICWSTLCSTGSGTKVADHFQKLGSKTRIPVLMFAVSSKNCT